MEQRILLFTVLLCAFYVSLSSGHEVISKSTVQVPPVIPQVNEHENLPSLPENIMTPVTSHQSTLKGMLKKRLRPGLGLGRGMIRATIAKHVSKDAIISRARGLLMSPKRNEGEKKKESRQSPGLVAGALAYGLATLPFMTLPLLFMGPLSYSKLFKNQDEEKKQEEKLTQTLDQIFNVASEILTANLNASSSPAASKFAQALGLNPTNLSEEPTKPNSAAAAAATGDSLFSPGLFNPNSNYIKNGKYKQYVFKQGVVTTTTTRKPLKQKLAAVTVDPIDALFGPERKSSDPDKDLDVSDSSNTAKDNLASIAKDVLKTVSDGIRKFELDKSECKERLVCEVSQKYAGSSFKSWATALMHVLDIDTRVEKSKVGKNAVLRTIYRGARSSLTPDKTCADLFPGCA